MPKCVCGRGLRLGPAGGAHSAPQRPLVGFVGRSGVREGKGRKTMEGRRWQGRGRAPETASSR